MAQDSGQIMTGAQALVASLERMGVDVAFGIPGGAILPAYDPLYDSKIRHILVRHEQGAGHAAEGYAMSSGRVGVCIATSGPGATNLVTPIANAYMDSTPLVAITGQVNSTAIGTDAFQEADIRGITMPITKHSFLIKDVAGIPLAIKEAFHIAGTGRPGPVLVDIAKDALVAKAPFVWPEDLDLPGYRPTVKPHTRQIRAAAKLISESERPVLYVGGGVVSARAHEELAELVAKTHIPVVTTLMARGALPDSHELNMGMPGMHGTVAAVGALQKADLLIALGTRFDDRVTGKLDSFAPEAKIIHADIDPAGCQVEEARDHVHGAGIDRGDRPALVVADDGAELRRGHGGETGLDQPLAAMRQAGAQELDAMIGGRGMKMQVDDLAGMNARPAQRNRRSNGGLMTDLHSITSGRAPSARARDGGSRRR